LWDGQAGQMLRGQGVRITYVKQLLSDLCGKTVDKLQWNEKQGGHGYHIQVANN